MRIYNTITGKKEEINLKEKIGVYVCGITPDGPTHLGHAFLFVVHDVLNRYLKFLGADVTYVQNVTDVDDDIIIRSKAAGLTWKEMGNKYTKLHLNNMEALNVIPPDYYPKATQNINGIKKIINTLIEKKFAYVKNGNVYFSIGKDKNFGKLSKYGYPAMIEIANERGNNPLDANKEDPLDFVLWQAKKEEEPSWPSPWGKGRPGWHIECSTMSMRYLGTTLTIHGGGADLIFPHHEAEIAQSENATGNKFVKHWMHTAMVYCDNQKMSKSLGNMVFVSELLKKYSANTIRLMLLSHHYRLPWNYKEEELKIAEKNAKTLEKFAQRTKLKKTDVEKIAKDFFRFLSDDFNTPFAIKSLLALTKSDGPKSRQTAFECCRILGLKL